jgi:hypothetical protein
LPADITAAFYLQLFEYVKSCTAFDTLPLLEKPSKAKPCWFISRKSELTPPKYTPTLSAAQADQAYVGLRG